MTTSDTSKDLKLKQTSLLEDFHVNHSQSLVSNEEQMMTATSGMKLLELLPKQNQNGLLEKMLTVLLTSKKVRSCSRYKKIWKPRVSKSNVLLFQLQASVRGIKEKGSGLLVTPTATQIPKRSKEAMDRRIAFRKSIGRKTIPFSSLEEQLTTLYPTPSASCQMDVVAPPETVQQNSKGWSVTRKGTGTKFGAKLNDVVNKLHGGKLNPNFVEFLMAYPQNWTKIDKTELKVLETQSFQKSQEKSDNQSSLQRMYRTPTAMDTQDEVLHFAAKWIKGKVKRASNSQVQKTLSMDVAIDYLNNNPLLIDQYDIPFKHRPKLPEKLEFIAYLKANTSIKELISKTDIPKTKIEHWFRKDKCFSYPSIKDWNLIKSHLKELKFNYEMTFEEEKDWQ